jgi:GTP-binding protein
MNKWDLIEKDDKTAAVFEKGLREKLGRNEHFPIIFISALNKQRIFKLIELAKEIEARRKAKIPTSQLNEIILEEIAKIPPPTTATGREVRIKYITQGGEHYPVFIFFANYPTSISESYKRFLENLLRKHFDYDGVPLTLVFKEK